MEEKIPKLSYAMRILIEDKLARKQSFIKKKRVTRRAIDLHIHRFHFVEIFNSISISQESPWK
jgi:hypothetical protein